MIDVETITAKLDLTHIDRAAEWAATVLPRETSARVELTPGDGTIYQIAVIKNDTPIYSEGAQRNGTRNHWVMLLNCSGSGYPWTGFEVDPGYAAEKWSNGHAWTGVVIAEFLTRLAAYWEDRDD